MSVAGRPGLSASFWRQWTATAISNLGDGINFAAMPLLAFSLTDDERLLALTTFAVLLPWLVLALPVGVVVDRIDRRTLMIAANLLRLGLFGFVAVMAGTGALSIWLLIAVLSVIGAAEVVFDSSAQAFLPAIVPSGQLQRANGYLFAAEVVAGSLVGLAIGAALFQLRPGLPFFVNAVSFGAAALLIVSIRFVRSPAAAQPIQPTEWSTGMRWLRDDPLLRTLAIMLAVSNFGLMLGQGIFVKYAAVELGVTGAGYGLLLAVAAAGAAVGALVGHRVARRLGMRLAIAVPYLVFGGAQLIMGLLPTVAVVATSGFVLSGAITLWNVVTVSLRQQLIPSHLFGRVNSVYRWVGTGASAVGALAGGQLAYASGLRAPFLVAGVTTIAAFGLVASPLLRGISSTALQGADQPLADFTPAPPSIT